MNLIHALASGSGSARWQKNLHAGLGALWTLVSVPILYYIPDSPADFVIIFISIYANVIGHWSAFQAVKVEVRQEEQGG